MRHLAILLAAFFTAHPAHAAGDGLFWPTVNFLLLVVVLVIVARKPLQTFFAERRSAIQRDLEQAAELKRQAEVRYAEWQRKLTNLEGELEGIRATAAERAETERESLLADARAAAERIRADAATAVEQEVRRAKSRLRDEASALAVELASEMLKQEVTTDDRERLLDEFIERVERTPGAES